MKKFFYSLLLASLACTVVAKNKTDETACKNWDIAFQLLQTDVQQQANSTKQNTCLSPLSLQLALAMVNEGASGQTRQELKRLLPSKLLEKNYEKITSGPSLSTANSIWINQTITTDIKKKFVRKNTKKWNAQVTSLAYDPAAIVRINQWCKLQTNGLIPNIVNRLDPNDRMVLVNTLYFKADWLNPFPKNKTQNRPFFLNPEESIDVPTMEQWATLDYAENADCQVVRLPYTIATDAKTRKSVEECQYALYVLLPAENLDCATFVQKLNGNYWMQLVKQLDEGSVSKKIENRTFSKAAGLPARIHLQMPKWETNHQADLVGNLQKQGILRIFTAQAELSGISKTPLMVSNILQKTYMKVDEKGTEAAAATAVTIRLTGRAPIKQETIEMIVNRPFCYMLVETATNTPVFVGLMNNPQK